MVAYHLKLRRLKKVSTEDIRVPLTKGVKNIKLTMSDLFPNILKKFEPIMLTTYLKITKNALSPIIDFINIKYYKLYGSPTATIEELRLQPFHNFFLITIVFYFD